MNLRPAGSGLQDYPERAGLDVVQDQVDTDGPIGRAMFTIIGAVAGLESSLISERVTAG